MGAVSVLFFAPLKSIFRGALFEIFKTKFFFGALVRGDPGFFFLLFSKNRCDVSGPLRDFIFFPINRKGGEKNLMVSKRGPCEFL